MKLFFNRKSADMPIFEKIGWVTATGQIVMEEGASHTEEEVRQELCKQVNEAPDAYWDFGHLIASGRAKLT